METVDLHKGKILVNGRIVSLCMSASIWTNIHSELMFIITRILLDNFGLKFMVLVKKNTMLNINRYFFIIYLAMVLASCCILASAVVLDPQAL